MAQVVTQGYVNPPWKIIGRVSGTADTVGTDDVGGTSLEDIAWLLTSLQMLVAVPHLIK